MEQTSVTEQNQRIDAPIAESLSTSQAAPAPVEKMIPQSKVDEIVRHANANVAQKARQDAIAEYQKQHSQQEQQSNTQASAASNGNDIQDLVAKQVEQQMNNLQQSYMQRQNEQKAYEMSNQFNERLAAVKDAYEDFDTVTQDVAFSQFPNAVMSSMNFDNTGDIMYELANNPSKLENIESLARKDAEAAQRGQRSNMAAREMLKISQALKVNQSAKTAKTANAPLSHIKPSPTGTDNGEMDVSDFRALFKKTRR